MSDLLTMFGIAILFFGVGASGRHAVACIILGGCMVAAGTFR